MQVVCDTYSTQPFVLKSSHLKDWFIYVVNTSHTEDEFSSVFSFVFCYNRD